MKRLIGIFIACLFFSGALAFPATGEASDRKNILILSFCSMNPAFLPVFGQGAEDSFPNFRSEFSKATLLTNFYTPFGWSNIDKFLRLELSSQFMKSSGYFAIGAQPAHSPGYPKLFHMIPEEGLDLLQLEKLKLDSLRLGSLRKLLEKNKKRPFILEAHTQFSHYPYLPNELLKDRKNLERVFTSQEIMLIDSYLNAPEKYPEKYPFFLTMFNSAKVLSAIKKKHGITLNLATDSRLIQGWKSGKNFDADLAILKKAYAHKLSLLDQELGEFLAFFNKSLRQNTILILMGDHGETFLDHDYITHGDYPYNEVVKSFVSISLPGQASQMKYADQVSMEGLAKLTAKLALRNPADADSLLELLRSGKKNDEEIHSYNCSGNVVAIRSRNKWKFYYELLNDKVFLYDLEKDPLEKNNLADKMKTEALAFKAKAAEQISNLAWPRTGCVKFGRFWQPSLK